MRRNSALVVLSGGQDSTTCLFWAKKIVKEVHAVTFDYGQRHRLELQAACHVADLAEVETHEIIEVPGILESTSPLVSENDLEQYENAEEMDRIIGGRVETTFVPMRNTLFLTLAANRAIALNVGNLVTGICQEDNANYPDCTETFRLAFQQLVSISTKTDLRVLAPLMYMSKAETVDLAYSLPGCWDALAYTHTGYDGKYPPTDMNHANVLRAAGFEKAGKPDPLVLRAVRDGLMPLPNTGNYHQQLDIFTEEEKLELTRIGVSVPETRGRRG
jgi:7-cyano-7-deazaguanine synthase